MTVGEQWGGAACGRALGRLHGWEGLSVSEFPCLGELTQDTPGQECPSDCRYQGMCPQGVESQARAGSCLTAGSERD